MLEAILTSMFSANCKALISLFIEKYPGKSKSNVQAPAFKFLNSNFPTLSEKDVNVVP